MRLWLIFVAVSTVAAKISTVDKRAAVEKMKMSPKEYKKAMKMHKTWYSQAVHSLLTAYAKKMFKTHSHDPHLQKALVACLDDVTDENAVQETADCLTHFFDGTLIREMKGKVHSERYSFIGNNETLTADSEALSGNVTTIIIHPLNSTSVTTTPVSTTSTTTVSPFKIATRRRHVKRNRKHMKDRKMKKRHSTKHRRVKRSLSSFLGGERTESKRKVRRLGKLESILDPSGSGIKSTTSMLDNILRIAKHKRGERIPFDLMMQKIEKLRDKQIETKTEDGYRRRMLDTVLGPDHPLKLPDMSDQTIMKQLDSLFPKEFKGISEVLRQIPGIEDKGRDRFLSPRFMPLFPSVDVKDNNTLLSPEIMPMYRLPSLLNATGVMERERNGLMSLIMESTGAMDVVDEALDTISNARDLGLGEDIVGVTNLIANSFNEMKSMFSPKQHKEMEDREFTFATSAQLKKLYGSQGMYNASEFPIDLDEYDKWYCFSISNKGTDPNIRSTLYTNLLTAKSRRKSDDEKEQSMRNTIRILAGREDDHPSEHGKRYKRALGVDDIVLPDGFVIKFFAHTTLSPYAFSPAINSLSVLGPTILSPTMFCPSFVSGLLLSPPVISPQLADPLFLSPYFLGPDVMSAAMFNIYFLSPYFMSPNVINPYVASPLILSPYVMCPDILSPTVLGGAILSPSVLSPQMYGKNAMAVSILSPSWLS